MSEQQQELTPFQRAVIGEEQKATQSAVQESLVQYLTGRVNYLAIQNRELESENAKLRRQLEAYAAAPAEHSDGEGDPEVDED